MPFCYNCGNQVQLDWKICPQCGKEIHRISNIDQDSISPDKRNDKTVSQEIAVALPARRIVADLIDLVVGIGLIFFAYYFMAERELFTVTRFRWMIFRALMPLLPAIYFLLKDSLGGKSFGKLVIGLTTINLSKRKSASLSDSLLRNAIFAIIAIPIIGWIIFGVIAVLVGIQIIKKRPQRLGDDFANTMVIEDRNMDYI
jgi:hypothetical protein